eukprot:CAMPEP_0203928692 /NCGR_PEP_ID=MMETSP0359-20131031/67856_1 /ASSEMBLY_ACC=CAM_ASM_000338 /TAXON_ID=268821 /ORGANISM="Scrippsiella Hangoei, Strain SHTV-5" /LENGTH=161 /DNA_ID=CAMNT_0050857641 /DNA_START=101 /DNA_END=583 /DNA_ORIENTATION=-
MALVAEMWPGAARPPSPSPSFGEEADVSAQSQPQAQGSVRLAGSRSNVTSTPGGKRRVNLGGAAAVGGAARRGSIDKLRELNARKTSSGAAASAEPMSPCSDSSQVSRMDVSTSLGSTSSGGGGGSGGGGLDALSRLRGLAQKGREDVTAKAVKRQSLDHE